MSDLPDSEYWKQLKTIVDKWPILQEIEDDHDTIPTIDLGFEPAKHDILVK